MPVGCSFEIPAKCMKVSAGLCKKRVPASGGLRLGTWSQSHAASLGSDQIPVCLLYASGLRCLRKCKTCIKVRCLPCLDPNGAAGCNPSHSLFLAWPCLACPSFYFSPLSKLSLRPSEDALTRTGKLLESALDMPGMRLTRALRDLRRLCEAEQDFPWTLEIHGTWM